MSTTDRPMLIEYGGYLHSTPPLPPHVRHIAQRGYRDRRRAGVPRYEARAQTAMFILWAVSGEGRPTRKYQAWLDSIEEAAA